MRTRNCQSRKSHATLTFFHPYKQEDSSFYRLYRLTLNVHQNILNIMGILGFMSKWSLCSELYRTEQTSDCGADTVCFPSCQPEAVLVITSRGQHWMLKKKIPKRFLCQTGWQNWLIHWSWHHQMFHMMTREGASPGVFPLSSIINGVKHYKLCN